MNKFKKLGLIVAIMGISANAYGLDDFVHIEEAKFIMGNTIEGVEGYPNEKPLHSVELSPFYISKYEVTFEEFDEFTEDMGIEPISSLDFDGNDMGRGDRPVINVSWYGAIAYANWLSEEEGLAVAYNTSTGALLDKNGNPTNDITKVEGYRLPTEAEWEYVARDGGRDIKNAWGNGDPYIDDDLAANLADDSARAKWNEWEWSWPNYNDGFVGSAPVGSFEENELGVYDMTGNVWEWCTDLDSLYTAESKVNPIGQGELDKRILRGGSWDNGIHVRIADRPSVDPNYSNCFVGFRLAKSDN